MKDIDELAKEIRKSHRLAKRLVDMDHIKKRKEIDKIYKRLKKK